MNNNNSSFHDIEHLKNIQEDANVMNTEERNFGTTILLVVFGGFGIFLLVSYCVHLAQGLFSMSALNQNTFSERKFFKAYYV